MSDAARSYMTVAVLWREMPLGVRGRVRLSARGPVWESTWVVGWK